MSEEKEKKFKGLFVELDPELHALVKIRSSLRNISIKKWIIRAIMDAVAKEEKYK